MPTLLWRVLHDMGYLEGQEPVYSWSESQLAEDGLAVVDITVPALGDALEWDGWHLEFEGRAVTNQHDYTRLSKKIFHRGR
jgi:hypothetical protein